jgi:hypothetical protein
MELAHLHGDFSDNNTAGTYSSRLRPELRAVARVKNPTMALATAAARYYANDSVDTVFGDAFADLAVTGRDAYQSFRGHQPTDPEITFQAKKILSSLPGPDYANYNACVTSCTADCAPTTSSNTAPINPNSGLKQKVGASGSGCLGGTKAACSKSCLTQFPKAYLTVDSNRLETAVQQALTRAYKVAWALRNPDGVQRYKLRNDPTLGWIAVSGEDDMPARPVNTPSGIPIFGPDGKTQVSSYPQYDVQFMMCPPANSPNNPFTWCPLGTVGGTSFHIRYTIASTTPASTIVATSTVANLAAQTNAVRSVAGLPMQMPMLSASVCLTSDGKNCLPPNTLAPPMGQLRNAIVTVSSGGQPVGGAAISLSGQTSGALTNASGVAVLNYNGCVSSTRSPVGTPIAIPVPCQAAAVKSGYQSASFNLP